MKLRPLLALLPLLAIVKLTACAASRDPSTEDPGGDGGPDGVNPDGRADGGPEGPRGSCGVTREGTAGLLFTGRLLLPTDAIDGELLIDDDGIIQCAAQSCATPPAHVVDAAKYQAAYAAATLVTCKDSVISPGLINPHDHITFANTPPRPHGTERFEHRHDWRKGIRDHKKISTWGTGGGNAVKLAELRFVMSGATSTAGAGGAEGLLRNVDSTAAQLEGLKLKLADSDTFPLGDSTPPTPFPPASCDGYPKRRLASTITKLDGFLPHVAEGVDEAAHQEFLCTSNAAEDPTHNLTAKQTAIVHGVGLNAGDIAKYHPTQTALVWSPRSNIDLYGNTAPVVLYDNLGVQIALGTDWLPSGSMNMSRELRCADDYNKTYLGGHFSEKQLWQMVTQNAAFAVGGQNAIGALKPGYAGDIAIFSTSSGKDYRAVISSGVEDVILVLRGGKVLYGDESLLAKGAGLKAQSCEDLDVCGVKKKACVKQDLGTVDLQTLLAETVKNPTNGGAPELLYPLFFCKDQIPKDEPSCTPYRGPTASAASASQYTSGAAGGDKDGDGVEDGSDNCPSVFNPIRPMDGDKQTDNDGDGIGDACDKCPLDNGEACTRPSGDDLDDDGILNGADNCPEVANPDQADDDTDGKGNACDACPDTANVGQAICVAPPADFTVQALRDPTSPTHPAAGGAVRARVKDLYVTGVRITGKDRGFFVQLDNGNLPFSGLYVLTGATSPTVSIGNKVDVEGDYDELFTVTTLSNPVVKVTDAGTTLPFAPRVVTAAEVTNGGVNEEAYESMLLEVDTVAVSLMNSDGASDFDEFTVTDASAGALRVDDYLYEALDNTYVVSTPFSKIIGVSGFSFKNRKLYPRSAADLVP
jgi:cytosine/adenosine deaminase-related metal-dependent hydrolase